MICKLLTGGVVISALALPSAEGCILPNGTLDPSCVCVDNQPTTNAASAAITSASPELRVRYDQATLSPAGKQLFIDGIKAMKAAPPRGNVAGVNSRYDEFVLQHGGFCNHNNSGFLPWHRKLLWEFESEVRALDPVKLSNFTIPYWNFNRNSFPSDLATVGDNGFMGPDGDPAHNYQVTQGPFRGSQYTTFESSPLGTSADEHVLDRHFQNIENLIVSQELINSILARASSYQTMSENLQNGTFMHNAAHNYVGGHLNNLADGADDPVFWMLHSYIDMLWTQWEVTFGSLTSFQQYFSGPALNDNLDDFGGTPYPNFDLGFNSIPNATAGDQLNPFDTTKLGYMYDITLPEPGSLGMFGVVGLVIIRRRWK